MRLNDAVVRVDVRMMFDGRLEIIVIAKFVLLVVFLWQFIR